MSDKDTLYARWLAGHLTEEEVKSLRKNGDWEALEAITKATENWSLPTYDTKKGYEKLRSNRVVKQPKIRRLSNTWAVGIAASLAIMIAAIFLLQISETVLKAGFTENLTYDLPDGSTLVLNDGSSVRFDENKWAESRRIHLTGEAYFDVSKGNSFLVETQNGRVEVLGTRFNVKSWENNFEVTCYEGKVRVDNGENQVVLTERDAVKVVGNQFGEIRIIDAAQPLWQSNQFKYEAAKLSDVFAEMERQFDISIEFMDIGKRTFSGQFQAEDLERALKEVCYPMGLKYTIDKKVIKIFNQ